MKNQKPIDPETEIEHGKELEKKSNYRGAIIIWQKLHKHDPENGYYLYHIGWNFSHLKEYAKAESYLQQSLNLDRENVDAMLALGYVYLRTDRFDLATKQFDEVLAKVPDYKSAEQGLEQVKKRRQDSLQKDKKEALRTQMERADHFEREGDLDQALLEWEKLSIEEPQNANYLFQIGRLYRLMKKPTEAEKYLEESLKIDPTNVDALVILGYVYYSLNKNDQAKKMFEHALENHPDYEDAEKGLESVNKRLESENVSDALAIDTSELIQRAEEYESEKRYQEALTFWMEMRDRQPDNSYYLYKVGQMYSRLGESEKAEHFLKKSVALNPKDADAWIALGYVYGRIEKFDEAKEAFGKALALVPDYQDAEEGISSIDHRLAVIAGSKKKT